MGLDGKPMLDGADNQATIVPLEWSVVKENPAPDSD
jgi:hypothetical protein